MGLVVENVVVAFDEVLVGFVGEQRDAIFDRVRLCGPPDLAQALRLMHKTLPARVFHAVGVALHHAAQGHGVCTEIGGEFHEVGKLVDVLLHAHKRDVEPGIANAALVAQANQCSKVRFHVLKLRAAHDPHRGLGSRTVKRDPNHLYLQLDDLFAHLLGDHRSVGDDRYLLSPRASR